MFIKRLKKRYWLALGIVLLVLLLVAGIAARRNYVQRFNDGERAYAYEVARSLGYSDATRIDIQDVRCGMLGFPQQCINITFGTPLSLAEIAALLAQQGFDPGVKNYPSGWDWWLYTLPRSVNVSFREVANDTIHTSTIDGTVVHGNLVTISFKTNLPRF